MTKIGILFNNSDIVKRDLSHPLDGNPGVGGSEYQRILLGYFLAKSSMFEVIFYTMNSYILPVELRREKVYCYKDAIKKAEDENVDVFIIGGGGREPLLELKRSCLKVIVICDLLPNRQSTILMQTNSNIKAIVCLGKWSLNQIDKSLRDRCIVISHVQPDKLFDNRTKTSDLVVMYQGAIVPEKGFHILARNWHKIKKFVPQAKLEILGSGALYGDDFRLGAKKIAEEHYEKLLRNYLLNPQTGDWYEDIKFWGIKGAEEKKEIMKRATVGIMNPSGITETWGLSASEFEALGIPVVTSNKNGCVDCVKNFVGGLRAKNDTLFVIFVVLFLKNNYFNNIVGELGKRRMKKLTGQKKVMKKWINLIQRIIKAN